jgi:hypothetical protein
MKAPRSTGNGLIGAIAAMGVGFGVSSFVTARATGDPGAMDRAFGEMYGVVFAVIFGALLLWVVRQIRHLERRSRRREYAFVAIGAIVSVAVFATLTNRTINTHLEREMALAATSDWRNDFERDLADAYWAWYRDTGGTESIYTGNYREFWALDPDDNGIADSDAPILRAIEDMGWGRRGVSVFDTDRDALIDQLEWATETGSGTSQAWCVPVSTVTEGGPSLVLAEWGRAQPEACS